MTYAYISSQGITQTSTNNLLRLQQQVSKLNEQLASGKVNNDLTDYDTVSAGRLLNFQSALKTKQGYLSAMQTVDSRLSVYESTLSDLEDITTQANSLASQNQTYDTSKLAALQAQITNYMQQVTNDLNQKVGDRYIYAGTRYSTAPVTDITALTTTPTTTTTTSPTLPEYDSGYSTTTTTDANAFTNDTAYFDSNYEITYGLTSNETCFQELVAGLRYMKEATNASDSATYQSNMTQAATLLASALAGLQVAHTQVANNQNILENTTDKLDTEITNIQNKISDIQSVDLTEVGTAITTLQAQMEASYSATSTMLNLSLLDYL